MREKLTSLIAVAALVASGCASSTVIRSNPPGAKIYIDGQYLGTEPVTQKDTAILGSSKSILLKKEGYRDAHGTIRKEEVKAGPLVAGIIFTIPLLWVMGYPSEYTFELEERTSAE